MSEQQKSNAIEKVKAHKAKMLESIRKRIEQCQATAMHYGLSDAETALEACLKALSGGGA